MAVLVNIHELRHAFAHRNLFEGLTFSIESGEKIALIGANGAGKSTLMKIIAGQMEPDSGTIARTRGLKVGYLPQVPKFPPGLTVREAVLGKNVDLSDWSLIGTAEETMSRFELDQDALVDSLSGGWQKKVALAHEISRSPDVLLLDEPTNHLDIDSILWLESWVKQAQISVVTISHDRAFLRGVANRTIEIDKRNPSGILSVNGGYDQFIEVKKDYIEAQESRLASMKNTMRRELEWLSRGAKARTTKQKARIDRALNLKDDVQELSTVTRTQTVKMEFEAIDKNPKKLIELKGVHKAYGPKKLLNGLNLVITPRTRLGLLGANGTGKSTLAKIIQGIEAPDAGTVDRAERAQVAYFEQARDSLDPTMTLLKTVCPYGETVEYQGRKIHVRSYLDRFLFPSDQQEVVVGKLSGGEQARLQIARLMLRPANILILDEPTNDLDLATLGVLEDCLEQFEGAVILVSHDRSFMDQVCDQILAFPETEIYEGIAQWETNRARRLAESAAAKKAETKAAATKAGGKKLSYKDQREFDQMEQTILEKETKLSGLQSQVDDPAIASNSVKLAPLLQELAGTQAEIDRLYARWAELEAMGAKRS